MLKHHQLLRLNSKTYSFEMNFNNYDHQLQLTSINLAQRLH
jgi:hypothetical protein